MIEMMVVMGIIATLLGILVVALSGAAKTAQTANTRALMNSMKQALIQFRTDIGYLPPILGHTDLNPTPADADLRRKLFDPRGPNFIWGDGDDVLPQQEDGDANDSYPENIQEWFSWTSPAEYLLGYGDHGQDGYGIDDDDDRWDKERPPLGIRDPGPDGVWGAGNVAGSSRGLLGSRMGGTSSNIHRGKVYGPYLELKDDNLLASTNGTIDEQGRLQVSFPGDALYDPDNPKVIVDYWGNPIRYYRRLYAPGSLASDFRPFRNSSGGPILAPPTLSDVFVLRPVSFKAGSAIDGIEDDSGDSSTTMALQSAEFALLSAGRDGLLNEKIRYDDPNAENNTLQTDFFNEDNIVELGP